MLNHYGGFSAYDIMYDIGGHLVNPSAENDLVSSLESGPAAGATDVALISHGWNNNIDEARALYASYFANVRAVLNAGSIGLPGKELVIASVFWPSKKFTDSSLIPGGAASVEDMTDQQINSQLDVLAALFPDPESAARLAHARAQLSTLAVSQSAQDDFVASLVALIPPPRGPRDEGLDDAREELDSVASPGHLILQRLSVPVMPVLPSPLQGGAASLGLTTDGGAASIFDNITGGIKSAALSLANVLTYYTMKDRAGIVGSTGVVQTIERIKVTKPNIRIHLIGHSFGGRLVTAAANALPPAGPKVATLTLLQAAYSHNGMAQDWDGANHDGAFRSILSERKVQGPIIITHSAHDWPNGMAYPVASRIMNQVAAAVYGGPNDKYGAIGRNGAQHTPESFSDTLHPLDQAYDEFSLGAWVRNLSGDGPPPAPTITAHGDVAKPEIAYAMLVAMAQNAKDFANV